MHLLFASWTVCLLLTGPVTSFVCEDDIYRDCENRAAMGHCQGEGVSDPYRVAKNTLAECRRSCREALLTSPSLPPIVTMLGGVEDHVVDPFGFHYNLCAENGGFTTLGREGVLFQKAAMVQQPQWVPAITELGFEKISVPAELWSAIKEEYQIRLQHMEPEYCVQSIINCEEIQDDGDTSSLQEVRRTFMMHLSEELKERLEREVRPLLETWAGLKLEHTSTYGIRRYLNGSWLASHLDRFHTHVISAIFNVGQSVREEWPLYIMDNQGKGHRILLKPGEMVYYESARAIHGRPSLLNGDFYDNFFIHFRPTGSWYTDQFELESYLFGGNKQEERAPITLEDIKKSQADLF